MLVLDGNIPRFPWEPSTTMLNYRLGGTTEASVSNRADSTILAPHGTWCSPDNGRTRRSIFARHGEPKEALKLLSWGFGGGERARTADFYVAKVWFSASW